jgi:hypothetical protein
VTCNSIDASGDGWCAFGIADSLLGNYPSSPMAVSSAVVWDLPDVSLVEYDIDSLFDPKNHGMKSSTPRIKSSALEPASKTFEFTVPHMIGQRSIDAAGDTNLVWAFKASGGWGKHSETGYSTLNLATGAATAPILSPAKVLHIVCMALAWGLFLPLGIVQSMAFKRGPCSSCGPWWFVAHIVLNVIGLGTMLVGGFFAFRIVPDGAHWTDPCVGVRWTWPTERARARLCSLPRHHPSCSPARRSQRYYSFRRRIAVAPHPRVRACASLPRPHPPPSLPTRRHHVAGGIVIFVTCLQPLNAFIRPHAPKANPPNPAAVEASNGVDMEAVRKMDIVSLGADGKPINGADTEAVRKMDIVSLGADGKPVFRNWLDLHRILRPGGHATHGTKAVRANTTFVLRLLWEVRWLLIVLIPGSASYAQARPASGVQLRSAARSAARSAGCST